MPTDTSYRFWHYDTNGNAVAWDKYLDNTDENNVTYGWDADDECYYVQYSPDVTAEHIVIPDTFNDNLHGEHPVKYLAVIKVAGTEKGAFQGNTYIKSVVLSDNVVTLNGSAFSGCTNLESVVMKGVYRLQPGQANRSFASESFTGYEGSYDGWAGNVKSTFGLNSMSGAHKGDNFSGATSLKYIVVGNGFKDFGGNGSNRFNFSTGVNIKVYVNGTSAAHFEGTDSRTFNTYYYNENNPNDGNLYWCYDNGAIKEWPVT